jgi:hypothetical protein
VSALWLLILTLGTFAAENLLNSGSYVIVSVAVSQSDQCRPGVVAEDLDIGNLNRQQVAEAYI